MVGVLLTVGFGVWNTGKQLKNASAEAEKNRKHESDEAQIDRLRNARREVYSDLVDAFIAVQGAFGRMADADSSDPAFGQEIRAMGGPVNKTWLISEEDTAHKARELFTVMNEQWLALVPKLVVVLQLKNSLASLETEKDEVGNRMLTLKVPTGITTLAPKSEWESYRLLKDKIGEERLALNKARIDLTSEVLNNQTVVMSLVNDVMLSARKELGIVDKTGTELGADRLAKQSSEMTERMTAALALLHRALSPLVGY